MPEKITVNPKFVFAVAGGIAAAAIALFVVMGSGLFNFSNPAGGQAAQTQPLDLTLSLADITPEKTDESTADLNIAFNVHNPNRNTAILETIHYTIFIDELKMTSGDIGVSPEGFVASQEGIFPIVSNTTVTLKDSQSSERNNLTAEAWDSMFSGDAQYRIEGMFAYKLTGSGFQFSTGERNFLLMYP